MCANYNSLSLKLEWATTIMKRADPGFGKGDLFWDLGQKWGLSHTQAQWTVWGTKSPEAGDRLHIILQWSISKETKTRKHRQSYRHADPCRLRVNVTVFVTAWPWLFNLWVNACWATAIKYMCTKFVVDSSSRFPFRMRKNRQTDATERPTHPRQ